MSSTPKYTTRRSGAVIAGAVARGAVPVAAEIRHERIVGVQHEGRRPSRPLAQRRDPAVGDRLELAVTVELVAEQVRQQHRPQSAQLRGNRLQPQLVDLEQAQLARDPSTRASGGQQRRGDSARHVRARLVVHQLDTVALEDRRRHRGCRRLAVRRGHEHTSLIQAQCERAERVRLQRQQQPAGDARRPAAPQA
ncbi:MAG TPA: hypothetical protein VNY31_09285 [Solirubrobacteraceae bacterium]|nr:hypothetical protein [Solirubrobacteraceae bacterium]